MVAAEELLADSLGSVINAWFNQDFNHPFLGIHAVSVSDHVKPIPKRWVEDVEIGIDEGFGGEEGDIMGEGLTTNWSVEEGRARLRDALHRLDLREEYVAHQDLNKMGKHELASEKRRVKQQLKCYDAEFRKQFVRLPTHTEKEPMRPLYVYYRRLKNMITQAEQIRSGRRSNQTVGSDDEDRRRAGLRHTPLEALDEAPTAHGAGHRTGNLKDHPERRRNQIAALEARIESLQSEKGSVRAKLQAFQEKFVIENNRKIRFHKDILPIEREYRMYKNLKEEIMRAESTLRDLRIEG